jgi:hypothetical protein
MACLAISDKNQFQRNLKKEFLNLENKKLLEIIIKNANKTAHPKSIAEFIKKSKIKGVNKNVLTNDSSFSWVIKMHMH